LVKTKERVEDGLSLSLDRGPGAAAKARRALAKLRGDLDAPLIETLRLLVTELVTNSVKHTGASTVELTVLVGNSSVLTEVTDAGPGFDPAKAGSPSDDHTGWGLFLVERLAQRWGVDKDGGVTKVWFELRRT
jgi:anti-sigma regulatory factor (Ser/Thr protein kinase)